MITSDDMISVQDLSVRFGKTAVVDGVSFAVAPGESVALWGENGAGKTTAIRALLGLVPWQGEVRIAGLDARRAGKMARTKVGYVPQQLAFYDDLTALGLLRYFGSLRKAPADQPARLLDRVALSEHAGKAVGALSGGMKQRLALAVALLGDPPILMLDEPTASLDTEARGGFLRLLGELRAAGKTLVVTSHRLAEVMALADRAVVLERGRVRLICPARDLEAALFPATTLHIVVAQADLPAALGLLHGQGFEVSPNGQGLRVRVAPGQRGAPVASLVRADLAVEDLWVEDGSWNSE